MHERLNKTTHEALSQASMEGNVYMPQNGANIAIRTAERSLMQEDPMVAISQLVGPLPLDEAMEKRTAKANAQHRLHNIGLELDADEVRRILAWGNIATINLIASALSMEQALDLRGTKFDESGNWSTEEIETYLKEIQSALTPQKAEMLRTVLQITKEALESDEVKEMMQQRKELFKDWKTLLPQERAVAQKQISQLSNQIIHEINRTFFEIFPDISNEMKQMAIGVQREVGKYVQHF
jgi:hypothetical protein